MYSIFMIFNKIIFSNYLLQNEFTEKNRIFTRATIRYLYVFYNTN